MRSIKIVCLLACPHYHWDYISSADGVEELLGDVVVTVTVFKCKVELVLILTRNICIR